ncbi:MAG: Gfo/Idh/MocA family protein [Myxococcota bacterium]
MKPIRVCLVGAGPMGRLHARKIAEMREAGEASVLSTIVDHHEGRAEEVAAAFGGEAIADLDDAFASSDVALIAVPTGGHAGLAERALRAGLDVLVEKPMASDPAEAASMIEAAEAGGRILQVGHVEWYNAAWREAATRAGTPRSIEVDRLTEPSERGLDLDVVEDLMLHDLDWVTRYVGGEVVEISAEGACVATSKLDVAAATLRFDSGCVATLRASRVHSERRRRVRIVGERGNERADLLQPAKDARAAAKLDPLARQWSAFLSAVRKRETPENSGSVGLAALRWVERVQEQIDVSGGEA